jgi:hypothetical protein
MIMDVAHHRLFKPPQITDIPPEFCRQFFKLKAVRSDCKQFFSVLKKTKLDYETGIFLWLWNVKNVSAVLSTIIQLYIDA